MSSGPREAPIPAARIRRARSTDRALVALAQRLALVSTSTRAGSRRRSARGRRRRREVGRARRRAAPARRGGGRAPREQRRARPAREPIDVELARLGAEADEARRRLEQAGAEPAEGDDRDELGVKLDRLERRREALGRVNPLAKEEYEAEKERLDGARRRSGPTSRRPSTSSRSCGDELIETVERRFEETFASVQRTSPRSPRRFSPAARAGCA